MTLVALKIMSRSYSSSGTGWQDYSVIRPLERPRVFHTIFEEQNGSLGIFYPARPFTTSLSYGGASGVGLRCTRFTCINSIENIGSGLYNHIFYTGGQEYHLRSSFYYNQYLLLNEMKSVSGDSVMFESDTLGFVKYIGADELRLPVYNPHDPIEPLVDSLAHKLGFQDEAIFETGGEGQCYCIQPHTVAEQLGDMFGPLSEVIVNCEELQPSVTDNVLCVIPLMCLSPRSPVSFALDHSVYKPLNDSPSFPQFKFTLLDKVARPLKFLVNRPSIEVLLTHL